MQQQSKVIDTCMTSLGDQSGHHGAPERFSFAVVVAATAAVVVVAVVVVAVTVVLFVCLFACLFQH